MPTTTIYILFIILLQQVDCLHSTFNSSVETQPTVVPVTSSPTPLPSKLPKLSESSKRNIYHRLLFFAANNKEFKTDRYIVYRIETIEPEYVEEIYDANVPNEIFPKSLIIRFIEENKITYQIPNDRSSLVNVYTPFKGDKDIIKFAQQKNSKFPKITNPVVLFSNLGIDDTHTQALIYMKFYGEENKIIRKYLHLKLKNGITFDDEDYKITSALVIDEYHTGESKPK